MTDTPVDINALVEGLPSNPGMPINLDGSESDQVKINLIGGIEVGAMHAYRRFTDTRSRYDYSFEISVEVEAQLLRNYDTQIAEAGGASLEQRIRTLEVLRDEYLKQQQRFLDRHGYIPGSDENGVEVQAVDLVLAELKAT